MSPVFFQNRKHQLYFELFDLFRHQGCPLCGFLAAKEQKVIAEFVDSICRGEKRGLSLPDLCLSHRTKARTILGEDTRALGIVKKIVGEKIK